jgi:hypothetical protein
MKIGVFDGSVRFDSGEIRRTFDRSQFLQSSLGKAATEKSSNGDWQHYRIAPEPGLAGSVLFQGERIDRIFISMRIPSDDAGLWTEELESGRKAMHDAWLRRELGAPPYDYAWGRVLSEFDAKSVASEIIVVYGT